MDPPVSYRFPFIRYFSIFSIAIVVDVLLSVFLWIGNPDKIEIMHTIKDFTIDGSVFDLVCISVGRCLLLIPILAKLEMQAVKRAQNGAERTGTSTVLKFVSVLIVLGCIVFAIFKGVKVILSFEDGKEKDFKDKEYALCIVFAVLSLLFSVALLGYFKHLKKLECLYARFNDNIESGSESCEDTTKPKKKVDVHRLFSLLKPVSIKNKLSPLQKHFIEFNFKF